MPDLAIFVWFQIAQRRNNGGIQTRIFGKRANNTNLQTNAFSNLVDVSFLEALEQEKVELAVLRGSLLDCLLDERNKLLLADVLRAAAQVVLETFIIVSEFLSRI